MTFSYFAQKLKVFYGSDKSNVDFVRLLFDKITLFEDSEKLSCVYEKTYDSINKYYNGTRKIPKNLASECLANPNINGFENFLEETNDDTVSLLCKAFKPYIPEIDDDNYAKLITDCFTKILNDAATKKIKSTENTTAHTSSNYGTLSVEENIAAIVQKLQSIKAEQIKELEYDPKAVKDKIGGNDYLLQKKILYNVTQYYNYILGLLKLNSQKSKVDFDEIAKCIKHKFEKIENEEKRKEKIFNSLVDWLSALISISDVSAIEAVVSFFVQNCEVFHATAK